MFKKIVVCHHCCSLILSMNTQLRWLLSILVSVLLSSAVVLESNAQANAKPNSKSEAKPGAAANVQSKGPVKRVDVLALFQNCRMFGDCDVYLSDIGIKMIVKKQGLVCLLLPPYKEVVCYSAPSGKIYRVPFDKFRNCFSTSMTLFSFTLEDVKLEPAGNTTKFSLPLRKFESTAAFGKIQKAKYVKHETSGGSPLKLDFIGSDKLPYNKTQAAMMEKLYALPRVGLFPVTVEYESAEEVHVSYLITAKAFKTTLLASDFAIPSNLKVAKEMQETLESGSSNEAMELMMGK